MMMRISHLLSKAGLSLRLCAVPVLLCACGMALAAAAGPDAPPAAMAPAGPTLVFWLPNEAHQGGAQFDARLDKPVRFWRAGLSLKEVFAAVAEQTEVEIGFWPAGDENERVRVNLYLNPDRPPSLRELMAQLAWATGCTFGYGEDEGETEPWTYYLLSTSVASGAEGRLGEARAAAMAALQGEWQSLAPDREAVEDGLDRYERALDMSREELIDRYAGVDDHLLAAMLDPPRRAATSFVTGLDEETQEKLLDGEWLTLEWGALSSGQQAALQSCLRAMRGRGPGAWGRGGASRGAEDWGGRMPATVYVGGLDYGRVILSGVLEAPEEGPGRRRRGPLAAPMLTLTGEGELWPDERVALRRALGETVSDDEARSLSREWRDSQREEMQEEWQERTREAAEAKVAEQRALSAEAEKRLSSFILPLDSSTPYALWQIQEAVAAASGMHVVSDCFSQPRRSLDRPLEVLYGEERPEMTGLVALRLSALSTEDPARLVWGVAGDRGAGWEWHDSGTFLRFRSLARDLWRATMLPPAASRRLDEWVDPYVADVAGTQGAETTAEVALDLGAVAMMAASLTDRQIRQGGDLMCGDPTEKASSYRQGLRGGVLRAMRGVTDLLRVMATLSESQWEQLRGTGLRLAHDLTPEQRRLLGLPEAGGERGGTTGGFRGGGRRGAGRQAGRRGRGPGGMPGPGFWGGGAADTVMRLSAEAPADSRFGRGGPGRGGRRGPGWMRGAWGVEAKESDYLAFWSGDEVRGVRAIPRVIAVSLTLPSQIGQAEPKGEN